MGSGAQYMDEAPKVLVGGVTGCTQEPSPKPHSWPFTAQPDAELPFIPQFLAFPCGLLRGALSTLGIESLVSASVATLPACEWEAGVP